MSGPAPGRPRELWQGEMRSRWARGAGWIPRGASGWCRERLVDWRGQLPCFMKSETFSPIVMTVTLRLARTVSGMMEASTIRRASRP